MKVYRIFDIRVGSTVPLPGLTECPGSQVDLRVGLSDERQIDLGGFNWIHEWTDDWNTVTVACARRGEEYLLRFPGLSDFHILLNQREIIAEPAPETSGGALSHLLVDQVIPRVMCHMGRVIMHASAILLPDNSALAFFGDSGRGKSTLAASFFKNGFGLVTDDCLQLDLRNGEVFALAAYPSLRLWPKSTQQLFTVDTEFKPFTHYSDKQQLIVRDQARIADDPVSLRSMFVLGDPGYQQAGIDMVQVGGASAAMALIEAAFILDVDDRLAVQENFQRVSRVAQSGVPVYQLNFPRDFEQLHDVMKKILKVVGH